MNCHSHNFDPKTENFGIGDPEIGIGTYRLVIHPVTYGLLKVSPDLCNFQKLTSETSKSNPDR